MIRRRHLAFTLVELLVVIGIIAVLVSILLPMVARVRDQGRVVACADNLRNLGRAVMAYAADNDGAMPQFTSPWAGNWLWDLTYGTRDSLIPYGATKTVHYCPASTQNLEFQDLSWDYAPGPPKQFMCSGYFWMTKRVADPPQNMSFPPENPDFRYISSAYDPKPATAVVIADAMLSRWGEFVNTGGGDTNHHRWGKPVGSNLFYVDGHVEWKNFVDCRARCGNGSQTFWY